GALGFATPARAFRAMLGDDAAALLEAYGIEDVPIDELDLMPGLIARPREERGDAPLS
ncbi:IS30 family transposase, partial [Collinsella sp. AF05-8-2]